MRALDRKLLRDLARLWPQALAVALVLAAGVTVLVVAFGTQRALEETRRAYYERQEFADVFATARRAPDRLVRELRDIAGVSRAETRVTGAAILDLPGLAEPAVGRVVSLPDAESSLNRPLLRSGRLPGPDETGAVAVNDAFAVANGFRPGDSFGANLGGRMMSLRITGTVLSPEFIYTIAPGALMPDDRRYAIIFMPRRAAAAALDLQGAFNDLLVKLTGDARPEVVMAALDAELARYGGTGAHDRSLQISHSFLDAELRQLRGMSVILPPVFFGVAAFLVNMVLGRLVALERDLIGLLKAVGYRRRDIAAHYLKFALLIAVFGVALGWLAGGWLSRGLALLYARFFAFPYVVFDVRADTFALSASMGILAAVVGALRAVWAAVALPPAVAMAPLPPPRYGRGLADLLAAGLALRQPTMMILRSLTRWPLRAGVTVIGVAAATATLIASTFFVDSLDTILDSAFYQSNRQDVVLTFARARPEGVLQDVGHLPGVLRAEAAEMVPVILSRGSAEKRVVIEARDPGQDLSRVVDMDGIRQLDPGTGVVLSDRLAAHLAARQGDRVTVQLLTGRRDVFDLEVTGVIRQFIGLGAYMKRDVLAQVLRRAPQVTGANLQLDMAARDSFDAAVKAVPELAGVTKLRDVRQGFRDTISENITIMLTIYTTIAVLITGGVTYNTARIQLSERGRELASLRILGFSRGEVSYILIGELALLALVAQPVGWAFGALMAKAMVQGFSSDLYSVPLILNRGTFGYASMVSLLTTLVAALIVRARLDRLDLVRVMKTRE